MSRSAGWALGLSVCMSLGVLPFPCFDALEAQDTPGRAGPRIGLVLSGGGAGGFSHIGVIETLESAGIPVHVVAGTSMGAVIGGLYAAGISADSLSVMARTFDWDAILGDRVDRRQTRMDRRLFGGRTLISVPFEDADLRLPSGAVEGSRVLRTLEELTWPWAGIRDFSLLPRPFAALATDLETGEAVRIDKGVLAFALRASIAVPGVVAPFLWEDGRVLVDGGLARYLPAEDALALGATYLICVDLSEPLRSDGDFRSLVDVLLQAVAFQTTESTEEQRALCDVLIRPDIDGLSALDFGDAEAWIQRGNRAARIALDTLPALRDFASSAEEAALTLSVPLPDSIRVLRIDLEGADGDDVNRIARSALPDQEDGRLDRGELDLALAELHGMGTFGDVRYRVDIAGSDTTVVFQVQEEAQDELGMGLRYDSEHGASVLFDATVANWLGQGSLARGEVRLGNEIRLEGSYLSGRGIISPMVLMGTADWTQSTFDLRGADGPVSRISLDAASARGLLGMVLDRSTLVGIEIRGEWTRGGTVIAPADSTGTDALGSVALTFLRDTFDDTDFPHRGLRASVRSEVGLGTLAEGASFHHHVVDFESYLSLHPRLTAVLAALAGVGGGSDLPLQRLFFLGGAIPPAIYESTQPTFFGLSQQERSGRAVQLARAGLRLEPRDGMYLTLGLDVGNAFPDWQWSSSHYDMGWGIEVAAESIIGPIRLIAHETDFRGWPSVVVSLGRRF